MSFYAAAVRAMVAVEVETLPGVQLNRVLQALGVARSVWYGKPVAAPKKPGRKPEPVPEGLVQAIRALAECYPWWGYKRRGGSPLADKAWRLATKWSTG